MNLRLSPEQLKLMRKALAAYECSIREQARPLLITSSEGAIQLCARRLEVESLLAHIDHEVQQNKVVPINLHASAPSSVPDLVA